MYSGASLTTGYGMHYRENFVHHSLEVPGLHGRGGIYFDDHEGSISNCSGNVMYKAAGRAFLVNGGAANNITRNLCVNGAIGIYNQHADDMTKALPLYDNGTLKRGDKGDYIWKTEQALGVSRFADMFDTPLARRWPTFAKLLRVNSTTEGWASAAGSNFRDNVFLNNSAGNVCLLTSYHGTCSCTTPSLRNWHATTNMCSCTAHSRSKHACTHTNRMPVLTLACWLTHSLARTLTHSLTASLARSLAHSLTGTSSFEQAQPRIQARSVTRSSHRL